MRDHGECSGRRVTREESWRCRQSKQSRYACNLVDNYVLTFQPEPTPTSDPSAGTSPSGHVGPIGCRVTPWREGMFEQKTCSPRSPGTTSSGSRRFWVASRQRRYSTRVRKIVGDWKARNDEHTIAWLADHPVERELYGLSENEVTTIHEVANRLRSFAPRLDPVVGSVKGIGLALFAYARMRSGADAIKPDIRVIRAMRSLGFSVPKDDHAVLLIARAAADEIGVSRLVLDQLLWCLDNDEVRDNSGQTSS